MAPNINTCHTQNWATHNVMNYLKWFFLYLNLCRDFECRCSRPCGRAVFLDWKRLQTFSRCTFYPWSNSTLGRSNHLKHVNNLPSISTRSIWHRIKMKNRIENRAWFCKQFRHIYYGKWNIMKYFREQYKREYNELLSCS